MKEIWSIIPTSLLVGYHCYLRTFDLRLHPQFHVITMISYSCLSYNYNILHVGRNTLTVEILMNWESGKFDEQKFDELYQPYILTAIGNGKISNSFSPVKISAIQ